MKKVTTFLMVLCALAVLCVSRSSAQTSYTDLVDVTGHPTWVYSVAHPFASTDVSKTLTITGGPGWTPGVYTILNEIDAFTTQGGAQNIVNVGASIAVESSTGGIGSLSVTAGGFSGPLVGAVGLATSNYTFIPPPNYTGAVTPSDGGQGGVFSPPSLSWTASSTPQTFIYIPASKGLKVISATPTGGVTHPDTIPLWVSQHPATVRIYAYGDSVTAYGGNYTGYYATDINALVPEMVVTVNNRAVSGENSAQMLGHLQADITANLPMEMVSLSTYLNDLGTNITTLKATIRTFVNTCLAHNGTSGLPVQVLLMTDNLSGQNIGSGYDRPIASQVATHDAVMQVYNEYSSNPNVWIVDNWQSFYSKGVDSGDLYALLLGDMVHPNAAGYAAMRANIKPAIVGAVNRMKWGSVAGTTTIVRTGGNPPFRGWGH